MLAQPLAAVFRERTMQTRHVLITLLVAAHVFVALAVVEGVQLPDRFGSRMLLGVVSIGQIGLLSIWTALGRRAAPWRPAVLIALIVAWIWVASSETDGIDPYLLVLFLLVAATTAAILATARGFGLRLFIPEVDPVKNDGPWQFSLSRLFAWTTSLSICLGLLSLTFRHIRDGSSSHWLTIAVVAIGLMAIILISPWLAWMRLRFSYTTFTFPVIFTLVLVLLFAGGFSGLLFTDFAMYCGLELLFLVGSLVVLRVAGYRLEFTRGKGSSP